MTYHVPVLAREIAALAAGRSRVVDGTLGGGGHTALFQAAGAEILGIDRDREALAAARAHLSRERLTLLESTFGSVEASAAISASTRTSFFSISAFPPASSTPTNGGSPSGPASRSTCG